MKQAMKKANSHCTVHQGNHRYQFQQIVQPLHNFPHNGKPSLVYEARIVQACLCGHTTVEKV
jgi:hypothetical protein